LEPLAACPFTPPTKSGSVAKKDGSEYDAIGIENPKAITADLFDAPGRRTTTVLAA
jgi:hypothetical protein